MKQLLEQMRDTFTDEEYRYSYTESFMNSYIAAQIKLLREQSGLSREELALRVGATKAGISRLENVGHSSWKLDMLRKIARALGVRLRVGFEEFGTLPGEIENFRRDVLIRAPFDKDPVFSSRPPSATQTVEDLALQRQISPGDAYPAEIFALGEVYRDATRRMAAPTFSSTPLSQQQSGPAQG